MLIKWLIKRRGKSEVGTVN